MDNALWLDTAQNCTGNISSSLERGKMVVVGEGVILWSLYGVSLGRS